MRGVRLERTGTYRYLFLENPIFWIYKLKIVKKLEESHHVRHESGFMILIPQIRIRSPLTRMQVFFVVSAQDNRYGTYAVLLKQI